MNNDRVAYVYTHRTRHFSRRTFGPCGNSETRIINSRPLFGTKGASERERDARGRERAFRGSYRGAGTKQDVNLARKTLYFPRAKLQMDVLGADPDSRFSLARENCL